MKDPLFGNKIAAAALATLLLFFGIPILVETFTAHEGHEIHYIGEDHTDPENPFGFKGYPVPVTFEGGPAVEKEPELDLGTLLASASASAGERRAIICTTCHTLTKGGADGTGPHLWNIVGREVAGIDGFGYTAALKNFDETPVWTYEALDQFIANSQSYVPGTAMAQKISKPAQRADILAYLQTLSDNPVAFPEPAPVEAAAPEASEEEGAPAAETPAEGQAPEAAEEVTSPHGGQ